MKNETNKTKSSVEGTDSKNAQDLSKFTLFYLFRYKLIAIKPATLCMIAGLDNMQMIIDFFNEGKQDELLKTFSSLDNISAIKKLCDKFSNPDTIANHISLFEERLNYYKIKARNPAISKEELLEWKRVRIRAIEKWNDMNKSVLKNCDIQTFIKDQKLSAQAADILCKGAGFTNAKQVCEMIFYSDNSFWKYEGSGFEIYKQIEKASILYITELKL